MAVVFCLMIFQKKTTLRLCVYMFFFTEHNCEWVFGKLVTFLHLCIMVLKVSG